MLGRTARFLRLLGYDTLYKNSYSDPELLKIAAEQNRILLTRDVALHQRAVKMKIQSILLLNKNYLEQIMTICKQKKLKLDLNPSNSRCATCNAKITPISKVEVRGRVPEKTFMVFNEFWICTNNDCGKIYYQGGHWANITKAYKQIQQRLEESKKN